MPISITITGDDPHQVLAELVGLGVPVMHTFAQAGLLSDQVRASLGAMADGATAADNTAAPTNENDYQAVTATGATPQPEAPDAQAEPPKRRRGRPAKDNGPAPDPAPPAPPFPQQPAPPAAPAFPAPPAAAFTPPAPSPAPAAAPSPAPGGAPPAPATAPVAPPPASPAPATADPAKAIIADFMLSKGAERLRGILAEQFGGRRASDLTPDDKQRLAQVLAAELAADA